MLHLSLTAPTSLYCPRCNRPLYLEGAVSGGGGIAHAQQGFGRYRCGFEHRFALALCGEPLDDPAGLYPRRGSAVLAATIQLVEVDLFDRPTH